jgi:hypothetical protein
MIPFIAEAVVALAVRGRSVERAVVLVPKGRRFVGVAV